MTLSARWLGVRRHLIGKASLLGLLPIIIALVGSAALNISYTRSLATTRELVSHSLRVNTAINEILSTMQDIETGQRGYLITGNNAYLAPYRTALRAIGPDTVRLERLVRDNPGQSARIVRVRTLAARKLAEVNATIATMRVRGFPAARALVANDAGKQTMDALRAVIADMRETERALLESRVATMHRTEQRMFWVVLSGIALALSARLTAFLLQLRVRRRRRTAQGSR